MRRVQRTTVVILSGVLWIGCGGNEPGEDCLGESDCAADNEVCTSDLLSLTGECEMKCPVTNAVNGGAGDPCGVDSDCASNDCRNDLVNDPCVCAGGGSGGTGGEGGSGGTGGSAGTGGAGGTVDPCDVALPQPVAPMDLKVDVYAVFDDPRTTPAGISFASDGTLYVGTNVPELTSPVLWVEPGGAAIGSSAADVFVDPDAVVVDLMGLVATDPGNVLIGGSADGGQTGQLMEMTRAGQPGEGQQVGDPIEDPMGLGFLCLRNINHLIFDKDERLLVTNFNNQNANVCAIKDDVFDDLIPDVEGDGPAGITVQDLGTGGMGGMGDLFVTTENRVHRYPSDGGLVPAMADYAVGSALAYGPADSPFEGLLIRRSGMLLLRSDVESDQETALLRGSIGAFIAFYPNDQNANLYISDSTNSRVLRVSPNVLRETEVGCPN